VDSLVVESFRTKMKRIHQELARYRKRAGTFITDAETMQKLRSLGYVK